MATLQIFNKSFYTVHKKHKLVKNIFDLILGEWNFFLKSKNKIINIIFLRNFPCENSSAK